MINVKIDSEMIKDMKKVHKHLKKELDFPDYYGENLDALYDMLTESCEDYNIILEKPKTAAGTEPGNGAENFDTLLSLFEAVQEENEGLNIRVE